MNCNAECGEAYLGLFMAGLKAKDKEAAADRFVKGDYRNGRYWQRAKQFAEGSFLKELQDALNGDELYESDEAVLLEDGPIITYE